MLYIVLLLLAVLGMIDALYIYHKNNFSVPMSCPLHSDCNAVLKSKWNEFLGVKNEVWGFVYFLFIFCLSTFYIFDLFNFINYDLIIFSAVVFGFVYSIFLTGVQIFKIKEYCFYCMISAGINLLMFLFTIYFIL